MSIKVAAYCRVSTDSDDQLHSLSSQVRYFTDYINREGDWELIEVYYDEGITGTSVKKRMNFNRMIADAKNGKIDLILTKEVSRFARNTVDTLIYTRELSAYNVGVVFTNDNIDTRDSDCELRLSIMASIAQEESRKTSERVRWGMERKTESGYVICGREILGFRVENGKPTVVPNEAEIVKRIFNSYVFERKGSTIIARELNEAGVFTVKGKAWSPQSVFGILKNEKYIGDVKYHKTYTANFLTNEKRVNKGEIDFIYLENNHEAIVSREIFKLAQAQIESRGELCRTGKKHSGEYWFSGNTRCAVCGATYVVTGKASSKCRTVRCVHQVRYGSTISHDKNGSKYGCTNKGINVKILEHCMAYIIKHIQGVRDEIIEDLVTEITRLQQKEVFVSDVSGIKDEIEKLESKKIKAVDLNLDGLLSKSDLEKQYSFYKSEIARLEEEIYKSQNTSSIHKTQIDKVREYISKVKKTAEITSSNSDIFCELFDRAVVYENSSIDFYLTCVPFGFKVEYHVERYNKGGKYDVIVDKCTIID